MTDYRKILQKQKWKAWGVALIAVSIKLYGEYRVDPNLFDPSIFDELSLVLMFLVTLFLIWILSQFIPVFLISFNTWKIEGNMYMYKVNDVHTSLPKLAIPLEDMRYIDIKQNVLGKVFNIYTLFIYYHSKDGDELETHTLSGISGKEVRTIVKKIEAYSALQKSDDLKALLKMEPPSPSFSKDHWLVRQRRGSFLQYSLIIIVTTAFFAFIIYVFL